MPPISYVTPANMRSATLAEFASGLALTQIEADDTKLTAAIAAASQLLDDLTDDHYEPATGVTLNLDVALFSPSLHVPKRIKAITTVHTRNYAGTLTLQSATAYRITTSLDSAGAVRDGDTDSLDLIAGGPGLVSVPFSGYWPVGRQTVQVVGEFGWTVTPRQAKRFVALICYDTFKEQRGDLGRAIRYTTGEVAVERSLPSADAPIGILEADAIVRDLRRDAGLLVW